MEITAAQLGHGYAGAHHRFRALIEGLNTAQLNWTPHPEANSIAVLIVHTLGSERWNLRAVRGLDNPRDRDAEFKTQTTAAELVRLLERADAELAEQVSEIDSDLLQRPVRMPDGKDQLGLHLLLANTGHAREHAAQGELTRQLLLAREGH